MVTFIIVSISVLSGFMINNFESKKKTPSQTNQDSISTEGVIGNYKDTVVPEETGFSYYINENAVKKTKVTKNDVTKFSLEAKLFITNKGSKTESIDPDAFTVSYDTEGAGLFYDLKYGDIEKPIILEGKATTSITFVVEYIIQDVEKFNDHEKHNLTFKYINDQILLCLV